MKNYLFIILIVLFTSCVPSIKEEKLLIDKEVEKTPKHRNYDFDITINTQDLQRDNKFNYKYLINTKYSRDDKNNLVFYKKNILQHVIYKYQRNEKKFDVYDRIPIDTNRYLLNSHQLDSIYLLTSKLFQIDTLNLVDNRNDNTYYYDGLVTEIELNNLALNTKYKITLSEVSDDKLLKDYEKLLSYIKNIEK